MHVVLHENRRTGIYNECEATTNKLNSIMINLYKYNFSQV